MIEATRRELANVLGTPELPGAEIVLAASGTDCELFALHAALAGHDRPLLSILIGPDEIGSGSVPAASGRHFDDVTPFTDDVSAGTPVEGMGVDRVRVEALPLRTPSGDPVPIAAIDTDVMRLAHAAVAEGRHVLLHVVDSSKTGMRAPSLDAVRRLQQQLGDDLTVLIDAAQMRTHAERLLACVADGAMLMISGSKFFTGAPFSGALVMPPRLAERMRMVAEVPAGFAAYISGLEVPPTWARFREALPTTPNLGLLMRWRTAIAEMQAFCEVPLARRNFWYRMFRDGAAEALSRAMHLQVVPAPVADRAGAASHDWDLSQTIFTFFPCECDESGTTRLLDYEESWQIYLSLNRDIGSQLPDTATDDERTLAATPCHVGQPVKIKAADGRLKGALRVAVGARFVSRVAFDPTLGLNPEERVAAQLDDLRRALDKTQMIVRHWSYVRTQPAVA
jgi:hypothetical protein